MAGRFVLLEFNDPDSAQAFVQNNHVPHQLGFSIRGLFLSPRKYCECPEKSRRQVKNWRRGKRTGIEICINCRRPSKHWSLGAVRRVEIALGTNLLEG